MRYFFLFFFYFFFSCFPYVPNARNPCILGIFSEFSLETVWIYTGRKTRNLRNFPYLVRYFVHGFLILQMLKYIVY